MPKVYSETYLHSLRDDFPMLSTTMNGKPLVYLDNAATALKPQCVIDAITDFYEKTYGTVNRAVYELSSRATSRFYAIRKKVQFFLNAARFEEIIFTKGTTESLNLVASSLGKLLLKPGDEVLISALEHHANIVPWQFICEQTGAILKIIPVDHKGEILLDKYTAMLSEKCKIVSVAHIFNSIGTINPIREMAIAAHTYGAKFVVDGAQSAPHMRIDVQELGCDFFVFSGHKLLGPTGIGVLYGKYELLEAMPPYQGGGDMIEKVTFERTTFQSPPLKFEAGTPMIAEVMGLEESINYLEMVGFDRISTWENYLLKHATSLLEQIDGLRILGKPEKKGAIISFVIKGVHPLDIASLLDLRGFALRSGHMCAQPAMQHFGTDTALRASFAFYNTEQEVDQFVLNLREVLANLQ